LGAAIDIGPSMARKIMDQNGSLMYRTYVISLMPNEIQSQTEQKEREEFDIAIEKNFGVSMNEYDLKYDPDYADL
jgi:hypothetical protein